MTTTKGLDLPQRITVLKHLAGGKSVDITATITDLTPETVLDLASHHGYPDTSKLAWAVDVLTKKHDDNQRAAVPASTAPRLAPAPKDVRPAQPSTNPAAAATPPRASDSLDTLLEVAREHPSKRIQNAASRINTCAQQLRELLRQDDEKNAARRKIEAEKAEARREVERLEEQLAAAKAKLRRKGTVSGSTSRRGRPLPKGHHPCSHASCDRVFDTPQGRSLHERTKCEHRPTAEQVAS